MRARIVAAEYMSSWHGEHREPLFAAPQAVFCGRSNVGKSSLINALTNHSGLARTSKIPGKTIAVNFFRISVKSATGKPRECCFADIPGYGFAQVARGKANAWSDLLSRYFSEAAGLRLAVLLIDARAGLTEPDHAFIAWLKQYSLPVLAVINKTDKLNRGDEQALIKILSGYFPGQNVIAVSSRTKRNIFELQNYLLPILTASP